MQLHLSGLSYSYSLREADASAELLPQQLPLPLDARLCGQLTHLSLDWVKPEQQQELQRQLSAVVACCSRLQHLSLVGSQADVDSVLAAVTAGGLGLLNLRHSKVTDVGLAVVGGAMRQLASLQLSHCRAVTDAGLASLAGLRRLEELDLYNVPAVSDEAVARLAAGCSALVKLTVGHSSGSPRRTSPELRALLDGATRPQRRPAAIRLLSADPCHVSDFERALIAAALDV